MTRKMIYVEAAVALISDADTVPENVERVPAALPPQPAPGCPVAMLLPPQLVQLGQISVDRLTFGSRKQQSEEPAH